MTRRVDYHELFDCDVREAAAWLEARAVGLGAALSLAVEQQIQKVIESPEAYTEVRPGIRRAIIYKYRYLLLYRLREDNIRFVGFVHGCRELNDWLESRPF